VARSSRWPVRWELSSGRVEMTRGIHAIMKLRCGRWNDGRDTSAVVRSNVDMVLWPLRLIRR
jgi:hypothetical protein